MAKNSFKPSSTKDFFPCANHKNYLHRVTALFCIQQLSFSSTSIFQRIVPLIVRLCSDPVENVRAAAARALGVLLDIPELEIHVFVKQAIVKLLEDKDPDVMEAVQTVKTKIL